MKNLVSGDYYYKSSTKMNGPTNTIM